MFKKVVILMFLGVVSVATITASAASRESSHNNVVAALAIPNVVNEVAIVKKTSAIANNQAQYSVSQDKSKNESTLPTTGWLLLSALIGFVLLSNRWSV